MAFTYTPGLGHAGCYIVSGYPHVTTGSIGSALEQIDYNFVTKEVTIMNTDSSNKDLYVLFAYNALDANKFKIPAGEQHTFDVKTRRVYLSGSSGTTYSACASLTSIPVARISEHSGSGINADPVIS
jgi:hypothetical protein